MSSRFGTEAPRAFELLIVGNKNNRLHDVLRPCLQSASPYPGPPPRADRPTVRHRWSMV